MERLSIGEYKERYETIKELKRGMKELTSHELMVIKLYKKEKFRIIKKDSISLIILWITIFIFKYFSKVSNFSNWIPETIIIILDICLIILAIVLTLFVINIAFAWKKKLDSFDHFKMSLIEKIRNEKKKEEREIKSRKIKNFNSKFSRFLHLIHVPLHLYIKENVKHRNCLWCETRLDFFDYLKTNKKRDFQELLSHWNNDMVKIFCCHCLNEGIPDKIIKFFDKKLDIKNVKIHSRNFYELTVNFTSFLLNFDEKHILMCNIHETLDNFFKIYGNKHDSNHYDVDNLRIKKIDNIIGLGDD